MTTANLTDAPRPESVNVRHIALEMYFLCVPLIALSAYLMDTRVMTWVVVGNIALRTLIIGRRADWIFLLIGVVAGGGNDLMSMLKGVYYYTPPSLLKQFGAPIPIWMLLYWGHIFVSFRQLYQLPVFQSPPFPNGPWKLDKRLIADLIVVVVFRIIIYNYVRQEPIPTIAFAAVLLLRLIAVPPKKHEWLLIVTVMIIGPAFEAVLIGFGLYVYFDPVLGGMPAWLLIYWAFALPLLMKGLFDRIEYSLAAKG